MASPVKLTVAHESWPIAGSFTISRGSKTSAEVVHVTLESDGAVGHGECVPYARYEETIDGAMARPCSCPHGHRSRLQPG
jgi:L-alanine-DL-glutamate epimerase-like enolase superfamily enzyme